MMPAAPSLLAHRRGALIAGATMLLSVFLLTAMQYLALNDRFHAELDTQAQIVGQNTSAALVFNAVSDAQEVLQALRAAPEVTSAQLLRSEGELFAAYRRSGSGAGWLGRLAGEATVEHRIQLNGAPVGRLVVTGDRSSVLRDLAKFWAGGVCIMAIALGLSWFVSRGLRASVRDAQERNRYLALHDALTGLPNRVSFQDALLRATDRPGTEHAVMFIDVDNFKQVNDLSGHGGGDQVLRVVAERLRSLLRPLDMVARIGGDEFAVLIEAPRQANEAAARVAADIVERVPRPIDFDGETLRVSVSVGIALLPHDAHNADDAMQCADAAMYQAKREGKDAFRFFSAALGEEIRRRSSLEADLRTALSEGQLLLHYQPVFDGQGRAVAMEGLMRWRHPLRGWVMPGDFIPLAESSGLIVELGLAALKRVRADLDAWQQQGWTPPPIALNLASQQFKREKHRQRFLAALPELGLTPGMLEFELTESAVFEDITSPDSVLEALRKLGFKFALDDFGTGYSSLSYLRRLKCAKLKIDKSFVRDMRQSEEAALLIRSIIDVAHALGMLVVAEGVETEEERSQLLALNCDLLQGYLMARPLAPEAVAQLLMPQPA
ncbi:putative bifunctional diguanylate cyclase/phosphodiesterase [Eleftheria terrae]|uniref:putative bifunctional diguanylate cyclase/phosphodiesterase n=1 Tax=Eleftheria terrae TaxID=1597781 RepID=UPI00263B920E|nr:EAL domain-containing protein [Eleftheria terrae]WKB50947.1 EAL domain-containing protein [Eleftheria terrae]